MGEGMFFHFCQTGQAGAMILTKEWESPHGRVRSNSGGRNKITRARAREGLSRRGVRMTRR